jgi:hypothetical protein
MSLPTGWSPLFTRSRSIKLIRRRMPRCRNPGDPRLPGPRRILRRSSPSTAPVRASCRPRSQTWLKRNSVSGALRTQSRRWAGSRSLARYGWTPPMLTCGSGHRMNRESEGKVSGIPHLAKNERDMGHPSFARERGSRTRTLQEHEYFPQPARPCPSVRLHSAHSCLSVSR